MAEKTADTPVSFETTPYAWKHWELSFDGPIATLKMAVKEEGGMRPGYELKLNSYDLGVDIELYDIIQRLRFEHPEVKSVVVSSIQDRVFCSGANIYMLAQSSHPFKVNFCKFTNETRGSLEEPNGPTFIAALNGTCAGGGYELAMACEEIYLVDDGSSAVSLPEVPLLGVLPGTGGLTRLVDKRKVRRDVADVFCTKAEGFKARDAVRGRLVDGAFNRSKWAASIAEVARRAADRAADNEGPGIKLNPVRLDNLKYVTYDLDGRVAKITIKGPGSDAPTSHAALTALGDQAWSLQAFRELEAVILDLRFNHLDCGLMLVRTEGAPERVLAWDQAMSALAGSGSWLARRILDFQGRTLRRLDNMAKSIFALIEPGNCFAGTLLELAFCADRSYMFADEEETNHTEAGPANAGTHRMANGRTRLENRFYGEPEKPAKVLAHGAYIAEEAADVGLVTFAPDEIDWDDEVRIAIEERVSLSPDALTGMEQNLRFAGDEGTENRIFGRLSAWQNWIFQRPNAVGERGALTLYGHPERPIYDFRRV